MFSENKKFSRTLRKISELCALGFLDVRSIIFYVVIACALIILTPVSYSPKYVFDVVITATGEKNDQAKSSEVWLMLPDYDALSSWPAKFEMPAGWERKRDVVVSYQNQPASISFSIESGEVGSFISFAEHEYSGVANVEINGRSINLDLYSAVAGQRRIDLYQYIDYKKRNLIGAYVKLIGFFFFYFFIFFLVGLWLSLRSVSSNFVGVDEPLWKKGLLYSLPSLFVYFIVHLIYWPGQLSPDSIDQWQQIVTGVFSDNHPVVGTLIYRFVAALHGSPSAPIVFQYLLLALIVGFLLSELRKWGVRHSVVWFLAVFIPFFPANFLIATTLWKDVLYTVLCLHLLLSGFVLLRKNWVVSRGFLASVFLSALLLANVRHNGIIVAPIVLTFFGIVRFRSKVGRILFLQAGVVLALVVGAKVFMNPFLGVSSLGQHYKAQHAVHIIAGMYERGAILSESEKQILEGFMPLSEWKDKYSCQTVVPIFWAKGGEGFDYLAQNVDALNRLAMKLVLENPKAFLDHQVCLTSIIWRITAKSSDWIPISPGEVTKMDGNDQLGLASHSVFPSVMNKLNAWVERNVVNSSFLGRPAVWFYGMFFLAIIYCRYNDAVFLILLGPAILNIVSLFFLALSPDYRYYFPVVMMSLFLIPFFIFSKVSFFCPKRIDGR